MSSLSISDTTSRVLPTSLGSKPSCNVSSFIDSEAKLHRVFDSLKKKINDSGVSSKITLVTSLFCDEPRERSYLVALKKMNKSHSVYCENKAAIFFIEIDLDTKHTSVRYGFGGHAAGKNIFINEKAESIQNPTWLEETALNNHFEDFLKLVLPEVLKWSDEYTRS